jgi:hypothetical protein
MGIEKSPFIADFNVGYHSGQLAPKHYTKPEIRNILTGEDMSSLNLRYLICNYYIKQEDKLC